MNLCEEQHHWDAENKGLDGGDHHVSYRGNANKRDCDAHDQVNNEKIPIVMRSVTLSVLFFVDLVVVLLELGTGILPDEVLFCRFYSET